MNHVTREEVCAARESLKRQWLELEEEYARLRVKLDELEGRPGDGRLADTVVDLEFDLFGDTQATGDLLEHFTDVNGDLLPEYRDG